MYIWSAYYYIMIINLLSGPRNVSTALMYSFAQRKDTIVMDEPFYGFYLLYTGEKHPGREEVIESTENDPNKIFQQIELNAHKKEIVFVKNMGHHLQGFDFTPILHYQNIFLIRDPAQMLVSYAKIRALPTLNDIGLKFQFEVFKWLQSTGKQPLVLDGDELRKNPSLVLSQLCHKLGISFTESMLSWPAGPLAEDGIWAKYWYTNVHKSSCFLPPDKPTNAIPDALQPVYMEALKYYQLLLTHSIKA
jgi:hypothetical protein